MQFQSILSFATVGLALFTPVVLACSQGQDCCWGGKDGGMAGCKAHHHDVSTLFINICDTAEYRADFCSANGVTTAQCDADCCSISTGKGRGCP